LVDDGSPDNCPKICDDYAKGDPRIKVVHKKNGGLVSARIAGIKEATGEYVYNLDSDDLIENDALENAYNIIKETNAEIVSFARRWVMNGNTIKITGDDIGEGFYDKESIKSQLFPKILMDQDMKHLSFYITGKAIKRELITPHQLKVSETISLGEDLCCVIPCYLNAKSVYISRKESYFYTVRYSSISKAFNAGQIDRITDVINEITTEELKRLPDIEEQLCRYSTFMCFAILASAAEGNYFKSIKEIKRKIMGSQHAEKIQRATFKNISIKSKISIFLMKKKAYTMAFYFLNFCKNAKKILKRG
jgi:glycosyltransferase involved in cell wall biosynthesis